MRVIEKTVFISYRRTNASWALAIFQNLTNSGYDVFYDYEGIASGDFERIIFENVKSRAHFLVLLTPSALERCDKSNDWMRREIETALETKRNIVSLKLDNFDFNAPAVKKRLTGKLALLSRYNALDVPSPYFLEAMERLRQNYLNITLEAVPHPASEIAKIAAEKQQTAARKAPAVRQVELTAQQWFERGYAASDPDKKLRYYSEAIHLDPEFVDAYYNRGIARKKKGDLDGALADYTEAIRLDPEFVNAYFNQGIVLVTSGDLDGALADFNEAIRLAPEFANAYIHRGIAHYAKDDFDDALADYTEAIHLAPEFPNTYYIRGIARKKKGDLDGALADYTEASRLDPEFAKPYYNRGLVQESLERYVDAITDFQKYLDLGGGFGHENEFEVKVRIKRPSKKDKSTRQSKG